MIKLSPCQVDVRDSFGNTLLEDRDVASHNVCSCCSEYILTGHMGIASNNRNDLFGASTDCAGLHYSHSQVHLIF